MRSKYNRFLLSTCLPVLAVSLFNVPSAHAGFEWTPPEKAPVVDVVPQPMDTMDAVVPDDVMTEQLPDLIDTPETLEIDEPPIEIKVMDDEAAMPEDIIDAQPLNAEKADMSEIESAVEAIDHEEMPETPDMAENIIIEDAENVTLDPVAINDEPIAEVLETSEDAIEDTVAPLPLEELDAQKAPTSLSINPYPTENDTNAVSETVVIPDNSEKTLTEMTPDDVLNETTETDMAAPVKKTDPITWNEKESFDVIEGFGKDIPLALALRQIVPAKYAFKFSDDLNPGERVSWNGGAPWNEVLDNALAPINVAYQITGNRIALNTLDVQEIVVEEEAIAEDVVEEISIIEEIAPEEDIIEEPITDVETAPEPAEEAEESDDIDSVTDALLNAEEHGHTQEGDALSPTDKLNQQSLENLAEDATDPEEAAQEEVVAPVAEIVESPVVEVPPAQEKSPLDDIYGEPADEEAMLEEILAPIEILEEDVDAIPAPSNAPLKEVNIERQKIIDPGQEVGVQPNISEFQQTEPSSAQKKNEVGGKLEDALQQLEKQSAFDQAENAPIALSAVTQENVEAVIDDPSLNDITPAAEEEMSNDIVLAHVEVQPAPASDHGFMTQPSNKIRIWEAKRGMDLQRILKKWQEIENVQIVWDTADQFKLSKDIFISGTFQNAVDVLFTQGFQNGPKHTIKDEIYTLHVMSDN